MTSDADEERQRALEHFLVGAVGEYFSDPDAAGARSGYAASLDDHLVLDLGLDSVDLAVLIHAGERWLDVSLKPGSRLVGITTLRELAAVLVASRQEADR